jgi:hypothetical protein
MIKKTIIFLTVLFLSSAVFPQTDVEIKRLTTFRKPADASQVMILGVYHFHNPGADYAKFKTADILSEQKQKEIAEVIERISKFKPTKIAIEWTPDRTEETNRRYADFLAGKFNINEGESKTIGNEVYQLGFRLAKKQEHKQLYLVDHPGGMDINAVMAYAKEKDPEYVKRFQTEIEQIVNLMNQMQRNKSVLEILRVLNKQDSLSIAQATYADMATVGAGDNFIGADVVSNWYKRNLKIFANLAEIAEPNDRILLIIGQGHKPILQQFVKESPRMKLVDVMDYL